MATVAAILAEYPADTIRHVTDPRTGIAANPIPDPDTGRVWTGMPNPAEVKRACEAHYGPVRARLAREKLIAEQERERITDAAIRDARPKKTYAELQAECAAVGLHIGQRKAPVPAFDPATFCDAHGVSKEQWDAIPTREEYAESLRRKGFRP